MADCNFVYIVAFTLAGMKLKLFYQRGELSGTETDFRCSVNLGVCLRIWCHVSLTRT